ncbi:MAG: Holliday junction ATP-dependent DNA helicase RuvA [Berkelbacteria bacterium GW2011_GWA2_35_9]|uniref:Holliday junction branch migration complex subunit RuvA n=1 Tax=Berkelbacteria bacterium GW2011_GWA2_35_9 TaxID=1618333 RepID=A0A0G0D4B3_9BACT|nr:MAG: Holliday junction ATP-dependent DNA helicase RuvA [Berkelbacteria bacterium GW2011_GWA2_35_9]
MIAYISGKIIDVGLNYLVVETNGVGYKVFSDSKSIKIEEKLELFTYHHITENRQELYGFSDKNKLRFFELLLSVNGVGPKMALAIMTQISPDQIKEAITNNDSSLLTSVSGVGKKVGLKIILELKSKLDKLENFSFEATSSNQELFDTLKSMGYSASQISNQISKIPKNLTKVEEKIMWAIKALGANI